MAPHGPYTRSESEVALGHLLGLQNPRVLAPKCLRVLDGGRGRDIFQERDKEVSPFLRCHLESSIDQVVWGMVRCSQ